MNEETPNSVASLHWQLPLGLSPAVQSEINETLQHYFSGAGRITGKSWRGLPLAALEPKPILQALRDSGLSGTITVELEVY